MDYTEEVLQKNNLITEVPNPNEAYVEHSQLSELSRDNSALLDLSNCHLGFESYDPGPSSSKNSSSATLSFDSLSCPPNDNNNSEENLNFAILKHLLGSEIDTKLVFNAYESNGCLMPEKGRNLIVHAFIRTKKKQLLKHFKKGEPFENWQVDKKEFEQLAVEIERIFPTESAATYYTPFRIERGIKCGESGKLYNHFEYTKHTLRADGILLPQKKSSVTKLPEKQTSTSVDESVKQKLLYLQGHSEDEETVLKYWTDTRKARDDMLKKEKINVHEYTLRLKRKSKTTENQEVENVDSENSNSLGSLSDELCKLLNNTRETEKRNSYMICVPVANEASPAIENLKKLLLADKLTMQPLILLIGSVVSIKKVFVIINDIWFPTDCFLDAIVLTLQSFFALDCQYPYKAKNLWTLIQIAGFDIRLPYEKFALKVTTLDKEINKIWENNEKKLLLQSSNINVVETFRV